MELTAIAQSLRAEHLSSLGRDITDAGLLKYYITGLVTVTSAGTGIHVSSVAGLTWGNPFTNLCSFEGDATGIGLQAGIYAATGFMDIDMPRRIVCDFTIGAGPAVAGQPVALFKFWHDGVEIGSFGGLGLQVGVGVVGQGQCTFQAK